jgi:protein-disulfide isomerase
MNRMWPNSMAVRRSAAASLLALMALAIAGRAAECKSTALHAQSDVATPVAVVNGKPIPMSELEEMLAPQLAHVEQQRRQILVNGIQVLVDQKLLEAEAAARGISVDELYKAEIEDKATDVTDKEAETFYQANQARINRPKAQVMPQIKVYLRNQNKAHLRDNLLTSLRAKFKARVLLEPVRVDVDDITAPSKGPADTPVTIVEFSDFQCPYCRRLLPSLEQVLETYPRQVRLVYRQFPLNIHTNAQKAAEASLCAQEQGKFWEMHDALFANQQALAVEQLKTKAAALGLNTEQFDQCLDSSKYAAQIREDMTVGAAAGVNGTPALFVNGRQLNGAVPFTEIQKLIEDELSRKRIKPNQAG